MKQIWQRLRRNSKAATAIEYGLIASLIVIAMVSAMSGLASKTNGVWNNVSSKVAGS